MTAYATATELATFTGATAPADAERLLIRASEVIDDYTRSAVYHVDAVGFPTDAADIATFRDATCAQVEFWLTGDEEDDIAGPIQSVSLFPLQVQFGAGRDRAAPLYLAPRAARILRVGGIYRLSPVVI